MKVNLIKQIIFNFQFSLEIEFAYVVRKQLSYLRFLISLPPRFYVCPIPRAFFGGVILSSTLVVKLIEHTYMLTDFIKPLVLLCGLSIKGFSGK